MLSHPTVSRRDKRRGVQGWRIEKGPSSSSFSRPTMMKSPPSGRLATWDLEGAWSNELDRTEQCCGVCLPTSLLGRIGIMLPRLDDLPAMPARDGAPSPLTPDGSSGPPYGVQKLPVASGRACAMLFRAGGPDWPSACGNCGNWRLPPVAENIGWPPAGDQSFSHQCFAAPPTSRNARPARRRPRRWP